MTRNELALSRYNARWSTESKDSPIAPNHKTSELYKRAFDSDPTMGVYCQDVVCALLGYEHPFELGHMELTQDALNWIAWMIES